MKKYIPHIVIAILIGVIVFQCSRDKNEPQANVEKVKAEAKVITDSLYEEIRVRDLRIANGARTKDSLKSVIKSLDAKLETIKKDKDEKITMAGTYTVGDQQRFFTERYK